MASGVPVVTSQCHGVNSFCVHGRNALIGRAKDPAALATLVSLVLGNDTVRKPPASGNCSAPAAPYLSFLALLLAVVG